MPFYHVNIQYTNKKGEKKSLWRYDIQDIFVAERVATPYMNNKTFVLAGRVFIPSKIERILVFSSKDSFLKLRLPDGTSLSQSDGDTVRKNLLSKAVDGVEHCTDLFIFSPPKVEKKTLIEKAEPTFSLMESASFLGLDINWSSAICALQLQEVAVVLVAKRKNIELDKMNVEKILGKKIKDLSFNDRYEAFSKEVKRLFGIDMPILTMHLRRMRVSVLHEGYNPKQEEIESIVSFTIGLLKKLEDIDKRTR
jgi:hypothetical protein